MKVSKVVGQVAWLSVVVGAMLTGQGCSSDSGSSSTGGQAGGTSSDTCTDGWSQVKTLYTDAGDLGTCSGTQALKIANSLMNLQGKTIDNNGTAMTPCVEAKCDSKYVYVTTNALPHYDFVQTTPNALVENLFIYRIPLTPTAIASNPAGAENAGELLGCVEGYNQYVKDYTSATSREPGHYCIADTSDSNYMYDVLADGSRSVYRKFNCLNTIGFMINGVPVFGPNEGPQPDAWGNPVFSYPLKAGDSYVTEANAAQHAAMDLCGGHTANSMHYHGVNEACFEVDAEKKPANSYVKATENWDYEAALSDTCTKESGIVGWSPDGYPIKGPCVCTQRGSDGSCTSFKRARSSWAYTGLNSWSTKTGATADSKGALSNEGKTCSTTADCCSEPGTGTCNFACTYAVFDDKAAVGGSTVGKRCVLYDYAWCSHGFVDRSKQDMAKADFVYLDRCNGFEGPDGYAYYATMSFPFIQGCYHGEPTTQASTTTGMGMGMGMGAGGMTGMQPMGGQGGAAGTQGTDVMECTANQVDHCCGDGTCDGPETAANCSKDCKLVREEQDHEEFDCLATVGTVWGGNLDVVLRAALQFPNVSCR
jgi:hypothetical protein